MRSILAVVVLGCLMFSCGDFAKAPSHIPASGGGADEVMVVADEKLWASHLEKPVTDLLNKEFDVLPQYEPVYKFGYIKYDALKGLVKQHRNIIILADLSDKSKVSGLVSSALGEEYTAKALNNPEFSYAVKYDLWSKPQVVFFIFSNSPQQLVASLNENSAAILDILSRHEIAKKYHDGLYLPNYNAELTKKVKQHLDINLRIPPEYFQALEKPNFLWFRWEPEEASNNLFIYTEPLAATLDPQRPLYLRDSLGRAFVSSKSDSAYMVTADALPTVQRTISINGYQVLETRGLWELENDFMGGPFINYYIIDKANNRAVMLDGFVYSPKGKKKMRIRFMETLFATFEQPAK